MRVFPSAVSLIERHPAFEDDRFLPGLHHRSWSHEPALLTDFERSLGLPYLLRHLTFDTTLFTYAPLPLLTPLGKVRRLGIWWRDLRTGDRLIVSVPSPPLSSSGPLSYSPHGLNGEATTATFFSPPFPSPARAFQVL